MKAKEDKIRDSYGEYYNDDINKNGWCSNHSIKVPIMAFEIDRSRFGWRPKSLQGIENNNGWIKIESEADLPKENYTEYFVKQKDNEECFILQYADGVFMSEYKNYENITHYQPIQMPLLPVY